MWLAVPATAFAAVGGVVSACRPRNPQGWAFGTYGATLLLGQVALAYALEARADPMVPLASAALWLASWMWAVGIGVLWTALQVLPDGHLVSPRWRWGVWLGVGGVMATVLAAVFAWPVWSTLPPTGSFSYPGVAGGLAWIATLGVFGTIPVAIASLVVRYRQGRRVERCS